MSSSRDDFPKPVARKLAERVSHRCSRPGCRKPTLGPSSDPNASVNLGKAAHITAAAKGGPRYDATLTPEERRSIHNGIWLCPIHADLVDKDAAAYPVALLHEWKTQAEKLAATEAFSDPGGGSPKIIFEPSEEDYSFLRTLGLPPEDTTEAIVQRLAVAARNDIQAFLGQREGPAHAIALDLTFVDESGELPSSLAGMAKGIAVTGAFALVSPPGTGKTTTLIQLAETILGAGDKVAVLLPLGEWEGTRDAWFDTLTRRNAFRSCKPQHFMQLAYEGKLVVLLDGWNELSPEASVQAVRQLAALRRDYPQLGVVLGTRQQIHSFDGSVVRVEPLHEGQQLELARQLRGPDGERLVDQAWRTSGLSELVTIPLYLNALLLGVRGDALPDTKDAILSSFVHKHESAQEKIVPLRSKLLGVHREMLTALASTATANSATALTEQQARRSIADAVKQLQSQGQLTAPLQPATVLDTLVDSHLLVRASAAGNLAFQHQQFQEWFASFCVEQSMLDAAKGVSDARRVLREQMLDRLAWEESILFACERLSRKDRDGVTAVAKAIIETLSIDPMLAAAMIQRSLPEVWSAARDHVMSFVGRWHTPDQLDSAVKFMITTGKADFADRVWPFLENSSNQVYLRALRLADPFRPSVLGPDAERRLASLPYEQRGDVLAEIAHRSSYDGMELAATIASNDSDPRVVVEVLEALEFRAGKRHVTMILAKASDAIWQELAKRGVIRKLADPDQRARLAAMQRSIIEEENDPLKQARLLLYSRVDGINVEEQLKSALISGAALTVADKGRSLFQEVANRFPKVAVAALVARLQAGHDVPHGIEDILDKAPVVDSGPIVDAVLKPSSSRTASHAARRLIGPTTVGKLIDAFVALRAALLGKPYNKESSDEYFACRDTIIESREESFLPALIARADTKDVQAITALAELLHLHGRHVDHAPMALSPEQHNLLIAILLRWSAILLEAPGATRHDIVHAVQAMRRVPSPELVPILDQMLQRDIAETAKEKEVLRTSRRGGVYTSWSNQYRATLAAIGDKQVDTLMQAYLPDLRFGTEAAHVLLDMWNRDHPTEKNRRFHVWHDYSDVKARRDQMGQQPPASGKSAEAIWEVVRRYGGAEEPAERQKHAVKLAGTAMRMPLGTNRPELEALFKLPLPYAAKQDLFVIAAMSGVVLSADMLTAAVRELLHDAKTQSWRLEENHGEATTWIELYAFSDQPLAVLAALDLLPPDHRLPYRLRRLLEALGQSPHSDVLKVLQALVERNPRIAEGDEWVGALVRLDSVDAARTLLEFLCSAPLSGQQRHLRHHFAGRLATFGKAHPAFRTELVARYANPGGCTSHDVIEAALLELASAEAVLAVIHGMASRGDLFDHRLSQALRKLAVGQSPSARWVNAMELFSVPLTALRKQLFALLDDEKQCGLARRCLEEIDDLRHEFGRINDEPRHPDIASGKPWPIVDR